MGFGEKIPTFGAAVLLFADVTSSLVSFRALSGVGVTPAAFPVSGFVCAFEITSPRLQGPIGLLKRGLATGGGWGTGELKQIFTGGMFEEGF